MLFLDASTPELVRRYGSTRRKHPLDDGTSGMADTVERERGLLEPVKEQADLVVDTTGLNVHQLKALIQETFAGSDGDEPMQIAVTSFGYKQGLPLDVDLVMDVRFLPNPHWIPELRPLTGLDAPVKEYVFAQAATKEFLVRFEHLLELLLPGVRGRGQELPLAGDRLHRRTPSLRGPRRGDRHLAARQGSAPESHPPRRRPLTRPGTSGSRARRVLRRQASHARSNLEPEAGRTHAACWRVRHVCTGYCHREQRSTTKGVTWLPDDHWTPCGPGWPKSPAQLPSRRLREHGLPGSDTRAEPWRVRHRDQEPWTAPSLVSAAFASIHLSRGRETR